MTGRYLFMGLSAQLERADFSRATLSGSSGSADAPDILITPLHRTPGEWTFRVVRGTQPPTVTDIEGVLALAQASFDGGYDTLACETADEIAHYTKTHKGVAMRVEPRADYQAQMWGAAAFNEDFILQSPEARRVLAELGVMSAQGVIRRKQRDKLIQIKNLTKAVYGGLRELDLKQVRAVDAACGKSYISFILYYYLHKELGYPVHFTGIDSNPRLIENSRAIQERLGYEHMAFHTSTLEAFEAGGAVDLLYSLHGCDTATDEAIALGVRTRAKMIIVVPCCHTEVRGQLGKNHPLRGVTRYGLFEDQFAALLTDAMRALALEAEGYKVATFRFVTPDVSTKNVLLRALYTGTPSKTARSEYDDLRKQFDVRPSIERLLGWQA
ncbi:MAG: methyltransferase [Anaerolineae bacterium]|nr:methyltransferase [Anaerolineae bacterium]